MRPPIPQRHQFLLAGVLFSVAAAWLWAHEGHAPLPSRGAQVDVAKGLIVLSRESREALDVQTTVVEDRALPDTVPAYATLVSPWRRHGFASARLAGRIEALHVQAGQPVTAGQVLAEVRSLELENLELELLNAQNDVRLAEKVLAALTDSSVNVSGQMLRDAETRLRQQQNSLTVGRTKWLGLGLTADGLDSLLKGDRTARTAALPVRSPVSGTVIHADLSVGRVVEPGEHLFEVVDLSAVWARIAVLERDLHRVTAGLPVELRLTAYPGETFRSTVSVIGLAFDPQTNLNPVWAEFPNPASREPRLLPGMTGQARIELPAVAGAKVVPAAALINDGLERYILVETAGAEKSSEYLKTPVVVRRQTADWAEVQSAGLYLGTRVVIRGAHELGGFFPPGALRFGPEAAINIGLRVQPAAPQIVENIVDVEGVVDLPPERRTVAAAHLGGNLSRILADIGQVVTVGEVLAEVSSIELLGLQMELLKEHLALDLLEQQFQSLRTAGTAVPQRKLLDVESDRNATRNRRDRLRRRLQVIGIMPAQIDDLIARKQLVEAVPVRAPVAGFVVAFEKALGQQIKAEEPLFEIHDLSRPLVQAFVSERDVARVRIGQVARVRLAADPATAYSGLVVRSGHVFAGGSQMLSLWIDLAQAPGKPLRHNQLAHVTLTTAAPAPTLAVPLAAVIRDGTQAFVFVRLPDGTFDRRAVETGRADDRFVEVRQGLKLAENVAVAGAPDLWTAYHAIR